MSRAPVRAVGSNGTPLWQIKGTSVVVAGRVRKRPTWIALYVLDEDGEPEVVSQRCPTCGGELDWTDSETGTCIDPECGDET